MFPLFVAVACGPHAKDSFEDRPNVVKDYIRQIPGEDEEVSIEVIKRGEVLIAYADCYECHNRETRSKGPAFMDIAKRYPIQQVYIDLLARKVISGGTGSWGYPVMNPHPKVQFEEAQAMVTFILSTKNQ